jgi:hypothetical protein
LDGLALRVENGLLERDVNVGCHKKIIIREGSRVGPQTLNCFESGRLSLQLAQLFIQSGEGIL